LAGQCKGTLDVLTSAAISVRGEAILDDAITPFLEKETVQDMIPPGVALSLQEVKREHIKKMFKYTNGHITKTAVILAISRPTLRQKIRQYNIVL